MSRWGLRPLSDGWEPRAQGLPAPTLWPAGARAVPGRPLGELAEVTLAPTRLVPGEPVYGPGGIDPTSGRLVRQQRAKASSGFRVGLGGLELGDVLVPRSPRTPCVLLSHEHAGEAFSRQFIPLRPRALDPNLLWAMLSSTTGMRVREEISTGTLIRQLSARELLTVKVPEQLLERAILLLPVLRELSPVPAIRLQIDSVVASSWASIDLGGVASWAIAASEAAAGPAPGNRAIGEFAEVLTSRGVPRSRQELAPFAGGLPLMGAKDVTLGQGPSAWVSKHDARVMMQPGDVLVTRAGLKHRIAVARARAALGSELLLIRLGSPSHADSLAETLASEGLQERLSRLSTGATIPRIAAADLLKLQVPWPIPSAPRFVPDDRRRLSQKLEDRLWA